MVASSIGILIPTFRAAKHLPYCLPPLIASPIKPRILIIDSSSDDQTVTVAKEYGVETFVIPKSQFNHGATREQGRKLLGTDIVVMLTQDAYATSPFMLQDLVAPLMKGQASIAYARQLPHVGARFFEAFPRSFNYPATSHLRSLEDTSSYGIYTFFCSNSCAAYLNEALDEIEGFPSVLFGEDTYAVAKLLHRSHKIAYVAEAEVRHSHDYSLGEEFRRHFDMGLARRSFEDLLAIAGKDSSRGKEYVRLMLEELKKKNPSLIPYAILQAGFKLMGYRLGRVSSKAPLWFKKACSSQKFYWKSISNSASN